MQLTLSDAVVTLYKKEMELQPGESIRLFVRVGGVGSGGFSVGVMRDTPPKKAYEINKQDVTFFVTEDDFWYVDGMSIDYNTDLDRVEFHQPRFLDAAHPEEHIKKEA
ncbi:iron-sulfur cluster biosynthesis family protein [Alkalicoccobacillus murimartini]|uniref:Uncharacterized protein YneR n=1 Tax=Alkalicoccobacillus murimartini TaxID=171685 RepID=A0ABT9YFP4_9BACI|nr:iron-sulfur cluster biosynthesis family protein [Alkalicoccobacillus murimartini]MDQ0206037.1 uncharacterized protein YneR [Alkalicoccobacillus murimartini]